jgi:hypothetical protein
VIANAITPLMPGGERRELTADEAYEVDLALEAAADWEAGLLPAHEAAKVGAMARGNRPSPAYTRFVAVQVTPRSDPRRAALQALQQHLDQLQGLTVTPTGTLTRTDLNDIRDARDLIGRLAS